MSTPNFRYGSILFLSFLGAYLFGRGFFLHRQVSTQTSRCFDIRYFHRVSTPKGGCWFEARYKRAIILVIDALKYDFTVSQGEESLHERANVVTHWANKMPIFEELSFAYPQATYHARFVADAPTTTLQRLTALLTGGMPTFIDAAANFYQSSIVEDNLVSQLTVNGKRVVFLGDETWINLLPGAFVRSYGFPSFFVHDLHTVDDGIIARIYDELGKADTDILIAHFLGVDHCGHWFHQNHPEMGLKLKQMNKVIANVSRQLNDGDLLVVMGDHGMTLSGDHGGDSNEEVTAALFLYAPSQPTASRSQDSHAAIGTFVSAVEQQNFSKRRDEIKAQYYSAKRTSLLRYKVQEGDKPNVVRQIDIVPTLSLLLGVPIPFSSLGRLIEPVFLSKPINGYELIPLWINVQQVQRYVNASVHLLKQMAHLDRAQHLTRLWDVLEAVSFNDTLSARALHRAAIKYLDQVQNLARSSFTVFNIPFMGLGLLHLLLAVIVSIFCALRDFQTTYLAPEDVNDPSKSSTSPSAALVEKNVEARLSSSFHGKFNSGLNSASDYRASRTAHGLQMYFGQRHLIRSTWPLLVLVVFLCLGQFSNSYVINEDRASLFIFQGLLLCALGVNRYSWQRSLVVVALMIAVRTFTPYGWVCRYEQACELRQQRLELHSVSSDSTVSKISSVFEVSESGWSATSKEAKILQELTSVKHSRSKVDDAYDSNDLVAVVVAVGGVAIAVGAAVIEIRHGFGGSAVFGRSAVAQLASVLFYVCAACLASHWFMQAQAPKKLAALGSRPRELLPNISAWCSLTLIIIFVLHRTCARSRATLQLNYALLQGISLMLLLCVYTEPRHAPALFILLACLVLILRRHITADLSTCGVQSIAIGSRGLASENIITSSINDTYSMPQTLQVALIMAAMSNAFFAGGHQTTFQQIRWKSGFVGAPIPPESGGFKMNDSSAEGSFGGTLMPAFRIVLNTFASSILVGFLLSATLQRNALRSLFVVVVLIRLTAQCIACFVLRQHLMLWAVFASRLLFAMVEAAVLVISVACGRAFCRNSAYWTLNHIGLVGCNANRDVKTNISSVSLRRGGTGEYGSNTSDRKTC